MKLLILRHAKSSWADPSLADHERPLAKRGLWSTELIGRYLLKKGLMPDLVLCSDARRALSTLELLAERVDLPRERISIDPRYYSFKADDWLDRLKELDEGPRQVLIVGHNPALENLVRLLSQGPVPASLDGKILPTAGLATFEVEGTWRNLTPQSLVLADMAWPKRLRKISRKANS